MMPPPLHVCSGLSSHVAMWQHWFDINSNFVGSFCPWYIFTQKLVSSSVGVAIHQISLKSVWYSCEVKNMSMLAWKRGTAGHTSGHSENIMPSTARRLHMHKTWNHPLFLKLWNSRKHLTYADFCLINYRQSIMTWDWCDEDGTWLVTQSTNSRPFIYFTSSTNIHPKNT